MEEEITRILKMVEEGKLSAEEANRLLSSLMGAEAGKHERFSVRIGHDKPGAEKIVRDYEGLSEFRLDLSACMAEMELWDQDAIHIEAWLDECCGEFTESEGAAQVKGARVHARFPKHLKLTLDSSASRVEGEIPLQTDLNCSAGKAELRGLGWGDVSISAGKAEIELAEEPGPLKLNVSAGKVDVVVPEPRKFARGSSSCSAGRVDVDERLIDPAEPPLDVDCSAGKVRVERKH